MTIELLLKMPDWFIESYLSRYEQILFEEELTGYE